MCIKICFHIEIHFWRKGTQYLFEERDEAENLNENLYDDLNLQEWRGRSPQTWVCARKAKRSCRFFISVFEPFRFRDNTFRLKLQINTELYTRLNYFEINYFGNYEVSCCAQNVFFFFFLLCSHEQHLNDAVHITSVAQVHESCLPCLRFARELQQSRGKRVWLRGPGTLVQHIFDLLFIGFSEVLEQYKGFSNLFIYFFLNGIAVSLIKYNRVYCKRKIKSTMQWCNAVYYTISIKS